MNDNIELKLLFPLKVKDLEKYMDLFHIWGEHYCKKNKSTDTTLERFFGEIDIMKDQLIHDFCLQYDLIGTDENIQFFKIPTMYTAEFKIFYSRNVVNGKYLSIAAKEETKMLLKKKATSLFYLISPCFSGYLAYKISSIFSGYQDIHGYMMWAIISFLIIIINIHHKNERDYIDKKRHEKHSVLIEKYSSIKPKKTLLAKIKVNKLKRKSYN